MARSTPLPATGRRRATRTSRPAQHVGGTDAGTDAPGERQAGEDARATAPGRLLGLDSNDWPCLVAAVEAGLPYRAFERLVADSTITGDDLRQVIGVPARTLARRKREGRFPLDESDRLLRVSRVVGAALRLFEGDRDAASGWLSRPHEGLGGAIPLELARTEVGALAVERLIGQLEHGVFV